MSAFVIVTVNESLTIKAFVFTFGLFLQILKSFHRTQENHETDVLMTNDDVLGDEIPFDQQDSFRQFCYQSLKLGGGVSPVNGFS